MAEFIVLIELKDDFVKAARDYFDEERVLNKSKPTQNPAIRELARAVDSFRSPLLPTWPDTASAKDRREFVATARTAKAQDEMAHALLACAAVENVTRATPDYQIARGGH